MSAEEELDRPLSPADELRELRDYYQQSRNALAPYAVVGVAVTAVGVVAQVWGNGLPWWVWVVLLVVAWHGFVGDLINVLYLRRRLAAAGRDPAAPGTPADRPLD
jgi:hypothetical protein